MKKIFSLILVSVILFQFNCFAENKTPIFERHIYESQYLGEPLTREDILNSAFDMINGKLIMFTTLASRPTATFIAYNITDDILDYKIPLQIDEAHHTKTSWSHKVGKDGCVYLVPHGSISLFKYDPKTRTMYHSEGAIDGLSAAYGVCFDDEENVYFGGFPKPCIYKYNKNLELKKEYGTIFPGESYIMSMVCYKGYLYAGGQNPHTTMKKIDTKTGNMETLKDPCEKFGIDDYVSSYYMTDRHENLIFCTAKLGSGMYYLFVYDADKEDWVFQYRRQYGHYMSPVKDGKTYFIGEIPNAKDKEVGLCSLDLSTFEVKDTGCRYYGNNTGSYWYDLNDPQLPGESLIFFSRSDNKLVALNPASGKTKLLNLNLPGVGVTIQDMETGINGNILMGSYMGDNLVSYNPTTGEKVKYASTQTESIKRYGNTAYAGCYTQAVMYEYDLTKPPSDNNPKILFNLSPVHQERIYDLEVIDDRFVVATTYPMKGYVDGGIAIYDKQTSKWDFYDECSKGQTVEGVCYKDGVIYGSTSIFVNASEKPTDEAVVFAFDLEKRKMIKKTPVKIKGSDEKNTHIGDIEIGPDGNIWGVTTGAIFCMDPETLEVKKSVIVDKIIPTRRTMSKLAAIYWDEEGYLYTACNGWFTILDPNTMQYKNTFRSVQYFVIGEDGNIYSNGFSANGSMFYKFAISALSDSELASVKGALSNMVVLKENSSAALVNSAVKRIDENNFNVDTKKINNTVMIPLRFISELFGGKVNWSFADNMAVIRIGNDAIRVYPNKAEMFFNNQKIILKEKVIEYNDRIYVPADEICKIFDRKMILSNDGIVMILPKDKNINTNDKNLMENINKYILKDVPKLLSGNFVNAI